MFTSHLSLYQSRNRALLFKITKSYYFWIKMITYQFCVAGWIAFSSYLLSETMRLPCLGQAFKKNASSFNSTSNNTHISKHALVCVQIHNNFILRSTFHASTNNFTIGFSWRMRGVIIDCVIERVPAIHASVLWVCFIMDFMHTSRSVPARVLCLHPVLALTALTTRLTRQTRAKPQL